MFRPAYIQPVKGIRSKTRLYRMMYALMGPLYPVWKALFPRFVTTTEKMGKDIIRGVSQGHEKRIPENSDINELAESS